MKLDHGRAIAIAESGLATPYFLTNAAGPFLPSVIRHLTLPYAGSLRIPLLGIAEGEAGNPELRTLNLEF